MQKFNLADTKMIETIIYILCQLYLYRFRARINQKTSNNIHPGVYNYTLLLRLVFTCN